MPNNHTVIVAALGLIVLGAAGFSYMSGTAIGPDGGNNVTHVLHQNVQAYNQENLSLLRQTMHPRSPAVNATMQQSRQVFSIYDLQARLTNVTVLSVNRTTARVRVTQVTHKLSGPQFRDNRVTAVHTLKRYNGEWRIYTSKTESIEYLD
ncbi:MAG: hypothetical protein SV186_04075 [Candidatus Nanohaloarchaea archaeon]|nr:hypothetical protein [Candidatus Nanohaloarchaea archaeon]